MAQDLLQNCLSIEHQFDEWYAAATHAANQNQSDMYWVDEPDDRSNAGGASAAPSPSNTNSSSSRPPPFPDTFAFPDPLTAFMCIYAWTGLVQLYLCIERLYWAAFEPDPNGNIPVLQPGGPTGNAAAAVAQINLLQYSLKVREMVANICRSLDFALESTVQPDMLGVPLFVVRQFYEHVGLDPGLNLNLNLNLMVDGIMVEGGAGGQQSHEVLSDGRLELVWCEGFGERLKRKGRDIAEVVMGRRWVDLASY